MAHHKAVLHQISFHLPSTIADLISQAPLSPPPNTAANSFLFCPVHPSHLSFWLFASPAPFWIWIAPFSCCLQFLRPLQKDFREPGLLYAALSLDHVPWIPVSPSLPSCISSPRTVIVGMFCPLWDVFACFISHAALPWAPPWLQLPSTCPSSRYPLPSHLLAPGSVPSSPDILLKTQTGS